jgi:acylphosphatase
MNSRNENHCLHLLVTGSVQGVGFRYFVQQHAQNLNLTGWVRNRMDDRVEILAAGSQDALLNLLSLVRVGPKSALVTEVEVEWIEPRQTYTRFSIAPTA